MMTTSRQVFIEEKALQAFRAGLNGSLIQPGDASYDQSRAVWNGMIDFPGFQEEGSEMMRKAYGPHYDRLVALKQKYDPYNLFRMNQNI